VSYPQAVYTGNQVIAAAVALTKVRIPGTSTFAATEALALERAVEAHLAACFAPHQQGPDIDNDDVVYDPLSDTGLACAGEPARP
jgi:hypothetical protein